jgi:GTPase SAR1 family protein
MELIIFIGASGVGKSTLAKKLAKKSAYVYHDMDEETDIKRCGSIYLSQAALALQKYSLDKTNTHICDFGAGFQNQPCFYDILKPYADKLINIHEENPEKIYRNRIPNRTLGEFTNTEHASHRERLYKLAAFKLTRTDNPDNDVMKILNWLCGRSGG